MHAGRCVGIIAASLACFTAFTATSRADLIRWKVEDGGNGHWYEAFVQNDGIDWSAAQSRALSLGGYLATATSAAENAFLFNLVDDPMYWRSDAANSAGPWLGGYQVAGSAEPAGGWRWVNDEGPFVFTNWSPGEPNNGAGSYEENYLVFWAQGVDRRSSQWNDVADGLPFRRPAGISYIVEFTTYPVPEPSSLITASLGLACLGGFLVRRRFPHLAESSR